jgi:hypothetical protein
MCSLTPWISARFDEKPVTRSSRTATLDENKPLGSPDLGKAVLHPLMPSAYLAKSDFPACRDCRTRLYYRKLG